MLLTKKKIIAPYSWFCIFEILGDIFKNKKKTYKEYINKKVLEHFGKTSYF